MDRRYFLNRLLAAAVVAGMDPRPIGRLRAQPRIDGERLNRTLSELARFGATPEGGTSRVAFSPEDIAAREYVAALMRRAGLRVDVDAAANLIGRRPGSEPLPPLMFGSHIDSVPEGGNYDGQVGSMAAVEVARTLADADLQTRHPLELVIFSNEEGGKTGSRAMSGEVRPRELEIVTASGHTIGAGLRALGGDPDRLDTVRRRAGDVAAFLELHVEQGGILDRRGINIGVVEGIVGIKRWMVTIDGFANHAGTTPMDQRQDALLAAGRFIDAAHRIVTEGPGRQVVTVGRIEAEPGAPNVIPGRARLTLELRDLDMAVIDRLFGEIQNAATEIGRATGTAFGFDNFYISRAAPTDPRIRAAVAESAAALGLSALEMPSGAGHDAQSIAQFGPVGMIFIPSVGGISHSPREHTAAEDIVNGANVLLRTLLTLDRAAPWEPADPPRSPDRRGARE